MNLENMTFVIKPHMKDSASWNLAVEEALYILAERKLGRNERVNPVIRLYSFDKPSVVLGYGQPMSDVNPEYCRDEEIDITRRKTGGGSVLLGEKDLQYSGIFPISMNGALPLDEAKSLIGGVNTHMVGALGDKGFSATVEMENENKVIRIDKKSFAFDALRFSKQYGVNGFSQRVYLHHGTILVDNDDYFSKLPGALRASPEILKEMQSGAIWINQSQQISKQALILALQKRSGTKVVFEDYTSEELALAEELHSEFYRNPESFPGGKSKGICYRPTFGGGPKYDLKKYAISDSEEENG